MIIPSLLKILKHGPGVLLLLGLLLPSEVQAAGQVFWDWPTGRQFKEIEFKGTAVNQYGFLVPGFSIQETGPSGAEVCWRVVGDGDGGFYTGTGHGGELYHTDQNGKTRLFSKLEGAEVFSLCVLPGDGLLAGCGPDGHFYHVNGDGESQLIGQISGGYVWAVTASEDGKTIWLATGSPARVFRYTKADGVVEVASFPAQNVLDVMLDKDGMLLVSTQGPGLVYRLDPGNPENPWLICETRQDEVRQFVRGPEDRIFFLALNSDGGGNGAAETGPSTNGAVPPSLMSLFGTPEEPAVDKAALFRLEENNRFSPFWAGNLDLMIVAWSLEFGWLGGGPLSADDGQSEIHSLVAPAGHHIVASWPGGDILDLNVLDGSELLVSQAHPGGIQRLNRSGEDPLMAISPALDGGSIVAWGRLNWQGVPASGKPRWSVRCGNRSIPDESWTSWTNSWTEESHVLDLPDSRFLQWRVELPRPRAEVESQWQVTSVSVSAWCDNEPPVVRGFTIENISDISRGGLVGMGDNVTQTFESGLKVEFGRKSSADSKAEPRRAAFTRPVRVMTWQGYDPNSDRLLYSLQYRGEGGTSWRTVMKETPEQLGSWDTSNVPDGSYHVRVVVSDRLDNPGDLALSSSRETGPLIVDNTPPEISRFKVEKLPAGLRVSFEARDKVSVLSQAFIRLPDGQEQRLDPVDRICDGHKEKFRMDIPWPVKDRQTSGEPWQVRVEVWDLYGNMAKAEGEAR